MICYSWGARQYTRNYRKNHRPNREAMPDIRDAPMTKRASKPPGYRSYILRCWEEPSLADGNHGAHFRFSLEDPHTGERQGFVNIQALTAFLQHRMEEGSTAPRTSGRD